MLKIPTLTQLLEAGVHFGHRSSRWNPKMKPFIFTQQAGIHVIDLEKTENALKKAAEFVKELAERGGNIVFLATKKQTAEIVKEQAQRVGSMYMTKRWLGGLLTNFDAVKKTIDKLPKLEEKLADKESGLTKKEQLLIQREADKMTRSIGGIRNLAKLPDALFVIDSRKEDNAVREANKMDVPVIALVDTNADPTKIDYPIPANDDAIKSVSLLVSTIADAFEDGKKSWQKKEVIAEKKRVKEEEKEAVAQAV
ncbi:MAG: 30S ribosomal protein S2 [Candidatus Woykebacteria bacterium]